ncbi:MAG: dTMP kinase [Alteromonadaceae bacterium]|nr:dTMP kinase [Alteromonadaceae bacterium]
MTQNGKFIVIEGLEGAGKSSAISVCEETIQRNGIDLVKTREPGGTAMAEAIREVVKGHWQEDVADETELMLMYAARKQLVHNVIAPALRAGKWVLADRHDMSTQAYQGGGRQIPIEVIDPLRRIALGDLAPDLVIYLDVEPAIGLERARGRGELDRIELAGLDFFERTRARYLEIAESSDNVVIVNAMQNMDKVQSDIIKQLENLF